MELQARGNRSLGSGWRSGGKCGLELYQPGRGIWQGRLKPSRGGQMERKVCLEQGDRRVNGCVSGLGDSETSRERAKEMGSLLGEGGKNERGTR